MAEQYVKRDWKDGEVLHANDLNNLEGGVGFAVEESNNTKVMANEATTIANEAKKESKDAIVKVDEANKIVKELKDKIGDGEMILSANSIKTENGSNVEAELNNKFSLGTLFGVKLKQGAQGQVTLVDQNVFDVDVDGIYYCSNCKNTPNNLNGYLTVTSASKTIRRITYTGNGGNRDVYENKLVNNVWSGWRIMIPEDTGWLALPLVNSWKEYPETFNSSYQKPEYRIIGDRILFRGTVTGASGTITSSTFAKINSVPTQQIGSGMIVTTASPAVSQATRINITKKGYLVVENGTIAVKTIAILSLNGLCFYL